MATFTKRKDGWFVQIWRKGYSARYKTLPTKAEAQAWAREQETLIDKRQTPKPRYELTLAIPRHCVRNPASYGFDHPR